LITPFNSGLKKATGFGKEKLYSMTMSDMDSMWKFQDARTPKTKFDQLTTPDKKQYENYKYPYYLNDTLVISEFTSLDDITHFVITGPDGTREILTTPGFLSSEIFSVVKKEGTSKQSRVKNSDNSVSNYLLAWTETINDPRWEQRNYSVIKVYDFNTSETRSLTLKSRYFAPSFSPAGHSLAAVRVDPENRSSIVIIDMKSGLETDTIITSDSDFYMNPSWSADGFKIVFTKLDSNGKSIAVFDTRTRTVKTLIPSTFVEISNPVFANDFVLFNGSYSGIENIYAANLKNNEIFQVTSAEFGACNADISPDNKKIVYSNYSSLGYSLAEVAFNPSSWKRLTEISDFSASLYKHLVAEESVFAGTEVKESIQYPSLPYKKVNHSGLHQLYDR
jgi:hypothetical protein